MPQDTTIRTNYQSVKLLRLREVMEIAGHCLCNRATNEEEIKGIGTTQSVNS